MKKIRILIADDEDTACTILQKKIEKYFNAKKISKDNYEITSRYTIDSTLDTICKNESFDIFFVDINFSEASAEKRNGYLLVQEAYNKCPLTYVCVHSGVADQNPSRQQKYLNFLKRGMLSDLFRKHEIMGENNNFFSEKFKTAVNFVNSNAFIWDLWRNHEEINIRTKNHPEIKANLESVIFLIKNIFLLKNIDQESEPILNRLIIQLYHRCLEIFVGGDADDKFSNKIANQSPPDLQRFGRILNWIRNDSVHQMDYEVVHENVLFANLTLTTYVVEDKTIINYSHFSPDKKSVGAKDLNEIISYLKGD